MSPLLLESRCPMGRPILAAELLYEKFGKGERPEHQP